MKRLACLALGIAIAGTPAPAYHQSFDPMPERMSDAQVRRSIIRRSIAEHPGPCPCPYSVRASGTTCGALSAYSRRRAAPRCYARDVSDAEVLAWRRAHRY